MIRKHYEHLIKDVCEDVRRLGRAVSEGLQHAMHSLQTRNTTTALWVIQHDDEIDEARRNLEERVITLLGTQQPIVAHDLRLLAVISAIATELERIGDYASSIARRVYRAPDHAVQVTMPDDLNTMFEIAYQMLQDCLEAFINEDVDQARQLGETDEEVDRLEDSLHDELVALIHVDARLAPAIIDMLDIVHALERVADRATNIGERVIYLETNEIEEINP